MAAITIDPPLCNVQATGGSSTHQLANTVQNRLAFKVKSSNNNEYRVKPVFGFIEPGASTPLEVIRLPGVPKEDKLVILWAQVPPEETDPQAPFKAGAQEGEIIMVLSAK